MRLSTAIMLGAATCEMAPGHINSCAYGAALNAEGVAPQDNSVPYGYRLRYAAAIKLWPWIAGMDPVWMQENGMVPFNNLGNSIWLKFDQKVCYGTMTLEQLADYVRSIEPDCDCCRFGCDCKEKEVASEGNPAIAEPVHVR